MKRNVILLLTAIISLFFIVSCNSPEAIILKNVKSLNATCPTRVADGLTLTSVEYTGSYVMINYKGDADLYHFSQDLATPELKQQLMSELQRQASMDKGSQEFIDALIENHTGIIYHYYVPGSDGSVMDVVIESRDLASSARVQSEAEESAVEGIVNPIEPVFEPVPDDPAEPVAELFESIPEQQAVVPSKTNQKNPPVDVVDEAYEAAVERAVEAVVSSIDEETPCEEEDETVDFFRVEVKPTFQGGDPNAFSKWVAQHLQYPESAKENGIMGRVILQFTIGVDGNLSDIKVVRGVDEALNKEAVRVVKSSPKWTPGLQKGHAVKVTYTFPVIFELR